MRKFLLAAAGATALVGSAAHAATVISAPVGPLPPAVTAPGTFILGSNLSNGPGAFSNMFTFTILGASNVLFNGQVSSQDFAPGKQDINFGTILVDGTDGFFTKTSTDPLPETLAILNPLSLAPGAHTLTVNGMLNSPIGSYVGNFNVNNAVPEAKTWAMMLLGFGGMGMVIRRRRKPALAQLA